MPNVSFDKTGNVSGRITVELPKEELSQLLNAELKKESKKVNIKGFRKGKVPMSALRKLIGNQVLGPMLDRTIQESLFGYIEEHKLQPIFSPIPVDDDTLSPVTATSLHDLKLSYDLALQPEFDLKMPEQAFDLYTFDANDAFLDEQVTNMLKSQGENKEITDGTIEAEDMVDVTIREVDGDLENNTKLYVDNLTDATKEKLVGKAVGTSFTTDDLGTLEENGTDTYVKKYLLELDDEETDLSGKSFTVTVNKISRIIPAELNEEFYTRFDPTGGVTDEESLRAKIAADNAGGFNDQGVSMANFEIQRALVEGTDLELPIDLMHQVNEEDGDQFELFERGVRWMLIRNKFAEEKDIKLEYEDIKTEATESLLKMLGGQRPDFLTDEFIDNYVQNMLQDEKQREQLASNALEKKIMAAVREEVTFTNKPLSADEFNEKIKAFNEANTPAREEEE